MKRSLLFLLVAAHASAAPFNIFIANNAPNGTPGWSTGLLTLKPLIGVGRTPTLATDAGAWATYQFANSNCDTPNPGCTPAGCEDGNATLLATRWGLTLGVDAWLVPALARGASTTVTIDAPVGSRLSYIAWVADTSVFDDFVALRPAGNTQTELSTLSVPLFNGTTPLENVEFVISGYDSNSTSATDGSGATCANECPAGPGVCYVAPGNATYPATDVLNDGTGSAPAVRNFTAVSGNGQARLAWTNVAPHTGVIIARRQNTAVTWTPTNGTTYTLNQQVQNQGGNPTTIIYAETGSPASAFTNTTGLTNGSRYFYKTFSFTTFPSGRVYSTGDVPSSQGIFTEPTTKTGQSPLWCYSFGFPSLQQPTTEAGARVFTSSNGGTLTANTNQPGTQDGWEAWRPVQLGGPVQMRSTLVPLVGRTGAYLLTGDMTGRAWLVRSSDGATMWSTAALGDALLGQPVVQLYNYANAAFQAAHPNRDVIFFSTRNASTTNNKVYGISSVNGAVLWTYAPNNLNTINGGMAVDYANNRLWVATSGATNSLRVLNTLTGAQVAAINLGPIDYGVNIRFVQSTATEALVITTAGTAYGFDLVTLAQRWTRPLGAGNASAWAFPLPAGFVASANGTVRRIDVFPDGGTAQVWNATVPGANGIAFDYAGATLFVGGTGSTIRRINYYDGGTADSIVMPGTATTTFGHPAYDSTASRLYVGTLDGRLCAFPVPFP